MWVTSWITSLATVTLQQQVEGLVSTLEAQALSTRQGRDGEISCARNSLSGSWMGMWALETPRFLGDGSRTHLELISQRALRRNHQVLEGLRMMKR